MEQPEPKSSNGESDPTPNPPGSGSDVPNGGAGSGPEAPVIPGQNEHGAGDGPEVPGESGESSRAEMDGYGDYPYNPDDANREGDGIAPPLPTPTPPVPNPTVDVPVDMHGTPPSGPGLQQPIPLPKTSFQVPFPCNLM